jgi:ribosomal protein S19
MTYYDKEVQKLGDRQADIKMRSIDGETRWMTVTPEQIQAILEILNAKENAEVTA